MAFATTAVVAAQEKPQERTIEELSDANSEFYNPIEGNLKYNDSLARICPAYELYHYSWTPLRVNPYGVKIDSIPDSVYVDCRDFVYPTLSNRITSNYGWRRYSGTESVIRQGASGAQSA